MINGMKLQRLREAAGISQEQLANEVGVSQSMIGHVESGLKVPSLEVMMRIAKRLDVTVDDLIK